MAEVATASVGLVPDGTGFGRRIGSEIGPQLDRAGREGGRRFGIGMQTSLRAGATRIFTPLIAAAGALAVGNFLGDSIGEARESQKVGATTTQIIKSTGGAAKVTAGQVGDLATAISNKTGIDDEAIQTGSNLLLTFKNVRNEVGQGANIFDRATAAAVDLSKAGFGDINGASKMLGKALNDPLKGITALGRAGVTFTDQQKAQIKALVKGGKTLAAQKIILKEVESQVGGVAAATATAGDKFSTTFANFKESVGTALLPLLDAALTKASGFFSFLSTQVGPALAKVGDLIQPVIATVKGLFDLFAKGDFTGGLGKALGIAEDSQVVDTLFRIRDGFLTAFGAIRNFIVTEVVPRFQAIVGAVRNLVSTAVPIVQQFVAGMMARIQPLLPAMRSIFGTIGQIVTGAMDLIKAVIERVTAVISFIWTNWGEGIMNVLGAVWSGVIGIIGPALETIRSIIATVTALIKGDWSGAWEGVKGIVAGVWNTIKGIVTGALGVIVAAVGGAMTKFGDAVNRGLTNVLTWFQELPGKILGAIAGLGVSLFNSGVSVIQGFINGLISKAGEIIAVIRDKVIGVLPDFVKDFLGIHSPSRVFMKLGQQTAAGMAVGLQSGARDVQRAAQSIIPSIRAGSYAVSVSSATEGDLYGQRIHPADLQLLARASANQQPKVAVSDLNRGIMTRSRA